jgi:hypothetical protein
MPTIAETVEYIITATSWDERVARLRLVPQRHGTDDQPAIRAAVARRLYVPHLAPDYAYVPTNDFYELPHFRDAYEKASEGIGSTTRWARSSAIATGACSLSQSCRKC